MERLPLSEVSTETVRFLRFIALICILRTRSNTVSLDHTIDMLRVIPVSMRRYMSGITTVERYGPGRGVSVLGSSVTYHSFGDLENVLHLASLVAPGWNIAESAEWKAAVDKDACVGDDWASTCYDCVSAVDSTASPPLAG